MSVSEKLTAVADEVRRLTVSALPLTLDEMADALSECERMIPEDGLQDKWCASMAVQALETARSWWHARLHGERRFRYNDGHSFLNGTALNDENGYGYIDCSTYIHLVLRGIRYEDSPYAALTAANASFDPDDLTTNTAFSWADDGLADSAVTGGLVRTAAQIAQYYFYRGRCFTSAASVRPGDIIFFSNGSNSRFGGISHVGMIAEDTSKMFNVTGFPLDHEMSLTSDVVLLTEIANRSDSAVLYARPRYEAAWEQEPAAGKNYLAAPWYTASGSENGVSWTVNRTAGTILTQGSATDEAVIRLVRSIAPIYLPAGTYRLSSGTEPYDRRGQIDWNYWQLVLVPSDGRTIESLVTGFSGSSHTAQDLVTQQLRDTRVLEHGFGTTFTIDTGMNCYAYIYISEEPISDGTPYTGPDTWTPSLTRIG